MADDGDLDHPCVVLTVREVRALLWATGFLELQPEDDGHVLDWHDARRRAFRKLRHSIERAACQRG